MQNFSRIQRLALARHRRLKGKIAIAPKARVQSPRDLSIYYTPGVGAVAAYLAKHPRETRNYTIKRNSVAVVSDGSAVLGLGNIGPEGALPVMEGKAMLFKTFAGIDAFPIVLATQDVDEIVETVKLIAPVFGGINLEDISAPRCFEVEERLKKELDIPVMHDDQHGTAVVVLAGLLNAFRVVRKPLVRSKIVIIGAGAAGHAVTKLLVRYGVRDILLLDRRGIIARARKGLDPYKRKLSRITNRRNLLGTLDDAVAGADALIGVSGPDLIKPRHIQAMNLKPIVFAMANPIPEIMPEEAKKAGAYIIATGRSDFPNQINNSLGFPGIFRGALDHGVRKITPEMEIRAAKRLASLVKRPTPRRIIPSAFDPRVVRAVASAIR